MVVIMMFWVITKTAKHLLGCFLLSVSKQPNNLAIDHVNMIGRWHFW